MSFALGRLSSRTLFGKQFKPTTRILALVGNSHHPFSSDGFYDSGDFSAEPKRALILGSSGCLGSIIARHLGKDLEMQVVGADIVALPDDKNNNIPLDAFISLPTWDHHPGVADVTTALVQGVSEVLDDEEEFDVIVCAAGGWQGDPPLPKADVTDEEFLEGARAYGNTIDKMMEVNLYPLLAAGYLANRYMADEGLFVAVGATAALGTTPGMLGYGLSKVGSHHFIQTLGEVTGKSVTTKSRRKLARRLRKDSEYLDTLSVIGVLPTTIDTPTNRKAMPKADFNEWTKPLDIAKEIGSWISKPVLRPHSGSLIKVFPRKGGGAAFNLVR